MNTSVKWAAELAHVQEVSLLGTADLAFWNDRLRKEDLLPAERDGQAQLLVIAANLKFMGVRFCELSFSVQVAWPQAEGQQVAAYLLRAFNSSRLFAFSERVFFSTPYYHGDVRLSPALPVSMHLIAKGEVAFAAEMGTGSAGAARDASRCGDDGWEGPIFLPESRRGEGRQGKLFVAQLRGYTCAYPFLPGTDSVTIRPSPNNELLRALSDSQFVAKEWIVREDARHAKSKTYRRAELALARMFVEPATAR